MKLPIDFTNKMKERLGDEYSSFINAFNKPKAQGLRLNPLKGNPDHMKTQLPFELEKIPWTELGYYDKDTDRPGKHPYHAAGCYYIQEPSAMAVGEMVAAEAGEVVLDLCAAPGGKTTHIASKMGQKGLLVANEIHPSRAKILSSNIERMGIKNAIVTNETPERLAKVFPSFFDRVLVDAPCSGEGMFRKHEEAILEWSHEQVIACANRQDDILDHAAMMVKPGGRLVYSTCTFSPEENEQTIERFIQKYPEFSIEEVTKHPSFDGGRIEWTKSQMASIRHTIRLWPHRLKGEGHFIAVLRKKQTTDSNVRLEPIKTLTIKHSNLKPYREFAEQYLVDVPKDGLWLVGNHLYQVPENCPDLNGLKVLRQGLHLGEIKKSRFEPSHALALWLSQKQVKQWVNYSSTDEEIIYICREIR